MISSILHNVAADVEAEDVDLGVEDLAIDVDGDVADIDVDMDALDSDGETETNEELGIDAEESESQLCFLSYLTAYLIVFRPLDTSPDAYCPVVCSSTK